MERMETLLEEALEAWTFTREGLIAEVEPLDDDDLEFRPVEQARSVADLIRHTVESGLMAAGELSLATGDFRRQRYEEHVREHAAGIADLNGRGPLLEALRDSHERAVARIREVGEIHMLQRIRRFDGAYWTRLTWLHHAIDHESYHRGQVALYVRLMGRIPALTRAIQGG